MLGEGPALAWTMGVKSAHQKGVPISVDLNHRPALGSIEKLWAHMESVIPDIDLMIVSVDSLERLDGFLNFAFTPVPAVESRGGKAERLMHDLYHYLVEKGQCSQTMHISCCVKESAGAEDADGLAYQKRWSVVVGEEGTYSTESRHLHHKPIQAIGGGDAWLAGFVDALVEQRFGGENTDPFSLKTGSGR